MNSIALSLRSEDSPNALLIGGYSKKPQSGFCYAEQFTDNRLPGATRVPKPRNCPNCGQGAVLPESRRFLPPDRQEDVSANRTLVCRICLRTRRFAGFLERSPPRANKIK